MVVRGEIAVRVITLSWPEERQVEVTGRSHCRAFLVGFHQDKVVPEDLGTDTDTSVKAVLSETKLAVLVDESVRDRGERREDVDGGAVHRLLPPAGPEQPAGPGAEQRQQDREEEEAVEETQQNDEEDHLGEGDDDVARVSDQWEDTQDGGQGS